MEEMLFKHPSNGLENRAWVQPEAQASKRIHPLSKVEEIAEDKVAEEEAPQATAINKQAYQTRIILQGLPKKMKTPTLPKHNAETETDPQNILRSLKLLQP